MKRKNIILFLIIIFAVFLRFYRINELMNFGGDVARDYLAARDITLKGIIPLVGSPSSVPWLYQGALFTYLLGIILWIGEYNPVSGGYFVGTLGVLGVMGVFFLGKKIFSEEAGLWAAFFYASSPFVVIFDRYPYHQSLISLFTILLIYVLYKAIEEKPKYFILSAFLFGLLMQLELSNLVLFPIAAIYFFLYRKKISFIYLIFSFLAFIITWTPKFIYDLSHGFTQTLGFVAWVAHKILPIHIPGDNPSVTLAISERLTILISYLSKIIFWPNKYISTIIFLLLLIFFITYKSILKDKLKENKGKSKGKLLILLWLFFPILGFIFQGSPSMAYVPVIFALPALLIGFLLSNLSKGLIKNISKIVVLFLIIFNGYFLITNNYFLLTECSKKTVSLDNAQSYKLNKEMARFMVDSGSESYEIRPLGSFAEFPSNIDTFKYLTWYLDSKERDPSTLRLRSGQASFGMTKYYIFYNFDESRYNKIRENNEFKKFPYMTVVNVQK